MNDKYVKMILKSVGLKARNRITDDFYTIQSVKELNNDMEIVIKDDLRKTIQNICYATFVSSYLILSKRTYNQINK